MPTWSATLPAICSSWCARGSRATHLFARGHRHPSTLCVISGRSVCHVWPPHWGSRGIFAFWGSGLTKWVLSSRLWSQSGWRSRSGPGRSPSCWEHPASSKREFWGERPRLQGLLKQLIPWKWRSVRTHITDQCSVNLCIIPDGSPLCGS